MIFKFGIITVSDSCFTDKEKDESGPQLEYLLRSAHPSCKIEKTIVPDEVQEIQKILLELCKKEYDIIFTTGGTGFAPRDVTPEATKTVITKETPGISNAIFNKGLEKTSLSMLSRAISGIRDKTLIINLSGSVNAVIEQFHAIEDIISHAICLIRNDKKQVEKVHEQNEQRMDQEIQQDKFTIPSQVKVNVVAARDRESPYKMISVDEAHNIIKSVCSQSSDFEVVNVRNALGRVLAEDIRSYDALPPFRSSIKDGYAIKSSDEDEKRVVVSCAAAGDAPTGVELKSGECIRISTGAPVPPGADAVVAVEDTELVNHSEDLCTELEIKLKTKPRAGQDIREIGSDIEAHSVVIKKGLVLNAAETGVLAAVGKTNFRVYKRPTVGIISTGNELQDPCEPLQKGHIRDSNKITLLNLLKQHGYVGQDFGLVKDECDSIKYIFERAFSKCDIVITTGGVSMGEFDVIKRVIEIDFEGKIHFGRVDMKPGKPTTFATCLYQGRLKILFGLPGNPVSATVTCLLFVIPTLRFCENRTDFLYPKISVVADFQPKPDPERPEYHRVSLSYDGRGIRAHSTGNQISSKLTSFVGADGLLIVEPRPVLAQNPPESVSAPGIFVTCVQDTSNKPETPNQKVFRTCFVSDTSKEKDKNVFTNLTGKATQNPDSKYNFAARNFSKAQKICPGGSTCTTTAPATTYTFGIPQNSPSKFTTVSNNFGTPTQSVSSAFETSTQTTSKTFGMPITSAPDTFGASTENTSNIFEASTSSGGSTFGRLTQNGSGFGCWPHVNKNEPFYFQRHYWCYILNKF